MSALPSVHSAEAAPSAEATRLLYERYSGRILAYCVSRLGSRQEAEDAMQTTFLNAFRSLQSGVVPKFELAWLFRIADNVCRDGYKAASRRRRMEETKDLQEVQDTLSAPLRNDSLDGLADALASMPERQRKAILLREWQGLSYGEIATKLDLSGSAVETLIFRARRSLARALEDGRRRVSGFDLLALLAAAKSALQGSAAAKVAMSSVAVGAAALVASVPLADQARQPVRQNARPVPAVASGGGPGTARPLPTSRAQASQDQRSTARPARKSRASAPASVRRPRLGQSAPAGTSRLARAPGSAPSPPATATDGPRSVTPPTASPPVAAPPATNPPVDLPEVPSLPEPPPLVPPVPPPPPPVLPPLPDLPVDLPPPSPPPPLLP